MIVTNAKVHTVDDERPMASTFAVKGGKFVAVGDAAEMKARRGEKTLMIDAQGARLFPASTIHTLMLYAAGGSTTWNSVGMECRRSHEGWP